MTTKYEGKDATIIAMNWTVMSQTLAEMLDIPQAAVSGIYDEFVRLGLMDADHAAKMLTDPEFLTK